MECLKTCGTPPSTIWRRRAKYPLVYISHLVSFKLTGPSARQHSVKDTAYCPSAVSSVAWWSLFCKNEIEQLGQQGAIRQVWDVGKMRPDRCQFRPAAGQRRKCSVRVMAEG